MLLGMNPLRLFLERFKPTNATSFVILCGISPVKWLQERSIWLSSIQDFYHILCCFLSMSIFPCPRWNQLHKSYQDAYEVISRHSPFGGAEG